MAYDESFFSRLPGKKEGGSVFSGFNIVYIILIFYLVYLIFQMHETPNNKTPFYS